MEGAPSPKGSQGPHSRDTHHILVLVILLSSSCHFQTASVYFLCVKYEHLKHSTNICKPIWEFHLCQHHVTSTTQSQVTSSRDLSTQRDQPRINGLQGPLKAMVRQTKGAYSAGMVPSPFCNMPVFRVPPGHTEEAQPILTLRLFSFLKELSNLTFAILMPHYF